MRDQRRSAFWGIALALLLVLVIPVAAVAFLVVRYRHVEEAGYAAATAMATGFAQDIMRTLANEVRQRPEGTDLHQVLKGAASPKLTGTYGVLDEDRVQFGAGGESLRNGPIGMPENYTVYGCFDVTLDAKGRLHAVETACEGGDLPTADRELHPPWFAQPLSY